MSFPSSISQLQAIIAEKREREAGFQKQRQAALAESDRHRKAAEYIHRFVTIFEGVLTAWNQPDPGKSGEAYFFLNGANHQQRVVAAELLPPEVHRCTPPEWEQYLRERSRDPYGWRDRPHTKLPPQYPVVPLASVWHQACPTCGEARPIIEHYGQVCDSPDGDSWIEEHLLLCSPCNMITEIDSEYSRHRSR
jgi:hypothetical protein